MQGEKRSSRRMGESERRHITKKPGLPLLIGRLKRTALKAGAHIGCCHSTHLGDGSLLPKMAPLLYWAIQWRLIWVELLPSWVWSCSLVLPAPFTCSSSHIHRDAQKTHIGQLTLMCSELRLCLSPVQCIASISNCYCIGLIFKKSQNGEARTWCECREGEEKAGGETLTGWESEEPRWRDGKWRLDEEQGPIKRPGICDVDTEVSHCADRLMDLQFIRHEWKGLRW